MRRYSCRHSCCSLPESYNSCERTPMMMFLIVSWCWVMWWCRLTEGSSYRWPANLTIRIPQQPAVVSRGVSKPPAYRDERVVSHPPSCFVLSVLWQYTQQAIDLSEPLSKMETKLLKVMETDTKALTFNSTTKKSTVNINAVRTLNSNYTENWFCSVFPM